MRLILRRGWVRELMALPFGIAIAKEPPDSIRIARDISMDFNLRILATVGDVVSLNVARYWREPDLRIVDLNTRRGVRVNYDYSSDYVIRIKNERSTLTYGAFETVRRAYDEAQRGVRVTVVVDGEEDLLAIPAVLEAPRGTMVLYGLYKGYLVIIPAVNEYKFLMLKLLTLLDPDECETLRNSNRFNNHGWKNS